MDRGSTGCLWGATGVAAVLPWQNHLLIAHWSSRQCFGMLCESDVTVAGLNFRLFGTLQITRQNEFDTLVPLQPTVQSFLAYLLLLRRRHHRREVLAGIFWGDHDENGARRCLSTTIWRLRRELEQNSAPELTHIDTTASEICFCLGSNDWLDVAVFEEKVQR